MMALLILKKRTICNYGEIFGNSNKNKKIQSILLTIFSPVDAEIFEYGVFNGGSKDTV